MKTFYVHVLKVPFWARADLGVLSCLYNVSKKDCRLNY